jgi:phosphoribosylaminoimidazole (AIR) synthetase
MRRTFNCGVGLILIVPPRNAEAVLTALLNGGETAFVCGELTAA